MLAAAVPERQHRQPAGAPREAQLHVQPLSHGGRVEQHGEKLSELIRELRKLAIKRRKSVKCT